MSRKNETAETNTSEKGPTVVYIRQSGTELELADTENLRKFAEEQGWKVKK